MTKISRIEWKPVLHRADNRNPENSNYKNDISKNDIRGLTRINKME
ncbi:MAG: hypothetical protein GF417_10700 [Candidatus Latescibacteria bacterium]|nr:hypothetical protein [Candidatus Latescibacterota bacterium]